MKQYLALVALAVVLPFAGSANAALMFVGYWDVADTNAPLWTDDGPTGPLAYTGQEAAALVFGGIAAEYTISTVDDAVANIDNMAWYSILGIAGGVKFAQDYSNKHLGQYYGPTLTFSPGNTGNAASAFVRDSLRQGVERNYAFRDTSFRVPEPSVLSMLLLGLSGFWLARRPSAGTR